MLLKLGTRRSLLARAQSGWVARELSRLSPGLSVELTGIDTRGDRIQDIPLRAAEGKEFFVAELDEALLSASVDLSVHSLKDLSLERPAALACAAIPRRENPRDVLLFGPSGVRRALAGEGPLRIGTSAPRRLENIPPFLSRALPRGRAGRSTCELVEIRGNVNTRLARVREAEGSERYLDGVVLAFAGLIRLWNDGEGRAELSRLLAGARWMVLPLRECPAAPGQGALAVECRAGDSRARGPISRLDDPESARAVAAERRLLAEWGGGCHQRFGATQVGHPELGDLLFVRGVRENGAFVEELRWNRPAPPKGARAWDAGALSRSEVPLGAKPEEARAVFVAHARAVTPEWEASLANARVWTSGTPSWFKLAERGIWVEGCAEGLGYEFVEPTLGEPVLALPPKSDWLVLTHEDADAWNGARVARTYRAVHAGEPDSGATHVFWSSGSLCERFLPKVGPSVHHACGPGKTARRLRELGLRPAVFPSLEEWKRWIRESG